ncbi:endonuclease [Geopseudomonas guangdongensis]|uniref:Deoxyribonuclease-1 n=1 Tax=Geopseudomonas guangdongensis TaxID=1245526 RepID=A0A1H2EM80_9GAMM|nr:deoxyribonuclease-1 [Pseudomonas guangdongensis]
MKKVLFFGLAVIAGLFHLPSIAAPQSFEKAKIELRRTVYFDRNDDGELYCGCDWRWMGRSGGRVDLAACGYEVRADQNRARRIEWEHVVPAWVLGHQRQCWQNGGRENCKSTDLVFRTMEADMHNLSPSIGEVNGDRSNFQFGMLPSTAKQYGTCSTKTDFKQRITEPRNEVKGQVARIYFYMHDRYGAPLKTRLTSG